MDLNRIYSILSVSAKNQVNKIILSDIGTALGPNFQISEKSPGEIVSASSAPVQQPSPDKKRLKSESEPKKYNRISKKNPLYLHGYKFTSRQMLADRYKTTKSQINYLYNTKGLSYEEMFPNPPPKPKIVEEEKKTLIKRVDSNGVAHIKLG
ncbi:MAG: hypothetical protein R3321_09800 [Nitrososphaeraceae archaeon]|nr:hypothetical protein [Nitrososphaeraceae archaeon]